MARVRLGWVWLIALMVAVMSGCGGDDSTDPQPDAATDRRTDTVPSDARSDTDVRTDTTLPDATNDPSTDPRVDPPINTPDADAPRPPDADASQPPPDRGPDTPLPDADASVPPPDVTQPPPDVTTDPLPPPDVDAGLFCTLDTQCPTNRPHCNTTTGACVSAAGVAVTPTNRSIALGTNQQFQATITYSDNSTGSGTSTVTWTSSNTGIATIVAGGLATSVALGPTTISAALGGLSGTTTLTVTDALLRSISVTPSTPSIALGTTQQFMATGTYSNATTQDLTNQVTWLSETAAVATITGAGLATSLTVGDSVIRATSGTVSSTATLHVTGATLTNLAVTPATPTIARFTTLPMHVTGRYTDNTVQDLTTQASWSSSDVSVATISNTAGSHGLVTGTGAGTSTIRATVGTVAGETVLTVTGAALQSISITPGPYSVAKGLVVPFTATGTYFDGTNTTTQNLTTLVTWSSSDPSKAVISNTPGSQGVASTVAAGATDITAQYGTISGMTTLTVTAATLTAIGIQPTNPSIAKGTTQQFTAIGTYTDTSTLDITTQVTWGSNNAAVGPISNAVGSQGLATGLSGPGDATISATLSGITTSTNLHVTIETLRSIGVAPTNPTIAKGTNKQFTATGTYTDDSTQDLTASVTWNSSNTAFATIDNSVGTEGLAHGAGVGSVTITATLGSGTSAVSGITTLTVTAATLVSIQLDPPSPSIPKGTTQALTATGTYTDGSTQVLTDLASWSSSNGGFATVSNAAGSRGLATGNNVGAATITAAYGGVSGSTVLTVSAATLQSIAVTPANRTIAAGTSLQYQATGTYSDTSTRSITGDVAWGIVPDPSTVATIGNGGTAGLATGVSPGEVDITATIGTVVGTSHLTVSTATLQSIQVDPINRTLPSGLTQRFTATGTLSNGQPIDLTAQASWSSSAGNVATISNATGEEGLATLLASGTTVITATFDGVSGTTNLTVSSAALVSIAITPANLTVANGTKIQYRAVGTYTDMSQLDLTANPSLTWNSAGAQATVSNAALSKGLASTNSVGGPFNITATYGAAGPGAIVGLTPLTITAATLDSITIAPVAPGTSTIARGTTVQFQATGHYSDASSQVLLASEVNWGSNNPAVATVSNAVGNEGLATGVSGPGIASITASVSGVTGSITLTVTAATLTSISITPTSGNINPTDIRQYTATGTYSDATTQDITQLVTWASTVPAVATISNAAGSRGLATAVATGDTAITATLLPGTPGSVPLHVNP